MKSEPSNEQRYQSLRMIWAVHLMNPLIFGLIADQAVQRHDSTRIVSGGLPVDAFVLMAVLSTAALVWLKSRLDRRQAIPPDPAALRKVVQRKILYWGFVSAPAIFGMLAGMQNGRMTEMYIFGAVTMMLMFLAAPKREDFGV